VAGELHRGLEIATRRELRRHALPGVLALAAVAALWTLLFSPGVSQGIDSWSHVFKAEALAGEMHERGLGAYFTSAWMPSWYLGDPYRTYYPPLTTLVLAPIQYLAGDAVVTVRLFAAGALFLYAVFCYLFLNRYWGPWPAAFGSILALWAPYQLRTLLFQGNLPRVLAFLALPLIAWGTERLLTSPEKKGRIAVLLGLLWAWTLLAHPQQAYMFAVGFAIYLVARLFLEPDVSLVRALWWVGSLAWGAALTLPWTLPAYMGNELPGVPYLPEIKVEIFAADSSAILPALSMTDGRILLGSGALILALLAAVARPEPRRTGYVLAGLLTAWFSLGSRSIGFALLPLHNQLLPERFLNFTAFALPVAAAGIVPFQRAARPARLFVAVSLLAIDAIPGVTIARPVPYPSEQAALQTIASNLNNGGGRLAIFTYSEPTALEVYFAGTTSDLLNGWALENTPHHVALRRVLGAPEWGPDYLAARLSLWDVRWVVVRGEEEADPAREAIRGSGFLPAGSLGPYEVWHDPTPSAPVQRLRTDRMAVAGEDLAPFVGAFPFAEEVRTSDFSQLAAGDLASRPALGLFRFEDDPEGLAAAEDRLRGYLDSGGTILLDLSGMEGTIGRTVDFLDVNVLRLSFDEPIELRWAQELGDMPSRILLDGLPEQGWSGAAYLGLDVVLGEIEMDGEWYPILGYKDVGEGRAWFVGVNLLYYGQLAGDARLIETIRETALEDSFASRDLRLESVPVREFRASDRGLTFVAEAEQAEDLVVSYTYTPRWEVLVDGAAVPFTSYEGLLRFQVPAGEHSVEVVYRPYGTAWPRLGLALGILAAVLGVGVLIAERKVAPLPAEPVKEKEELSYAPCANCGFRLAEQSAPTAVTYPFNVVSCPICGLRMDDEGFAPGASLTAEEREQHLTRWLESHHYVPEQVYHRWGFGVDDFFDPGAVAGGGAPAGPASEGSDAE
jgi:hypothetical protein